MHYFIAVDTFPRFHEKFQDYFLDKKAEGRYEDPKYPKDTLAIREIRFYDFAVPVSREKEFLHDLRPFKAEWFKEGETRWGQRRKGIIDSVMYKLMPKLLPVDLIRLDLVPPNTEVWKQIREEGWFAHAFPMFKVKDGFHVDGRLGEKEIF